jgi:hypothetical protein
MALSNPEINTSFVSFIIGRCSENRSPFTHHQLTLDDGVPHLMSVHIETQNLPWL